ncbi:uncharacterized protein ACIBXB_011393 [Morphnus guianensis]
MQLTHTEVQAEGKGRGQSPSCRNILPGGELGCSRRKRFWLTGAPATLTAVALAAQETNRPPFGARRSRKLARLQVENLPRQCFESNMPHLPAGELEIAIPDLCSRRLLMPNLRTLCSLLPYKEQMKWGLKAREIRSRTELSKRMRLYSRKGNYKKVHVHGYHPHDRQRPMEKPNNS